MPRHLTAEEVHLTPEADAEAGHVTLLAGLLWQRIIRESRELELRAEITNFVPVTDDQIELMKVALTNIGAQHLCVGV